MAPKWKLLRRRYFFKACNRNVHRPKDQMIFPNDTSLPAYLKRKEEPQLGYSKMKSLQVKKPQSRKFTTIENDL